MSYISRKSVEWIKVTAFFPKAFLQKYYFLTNFDPPQFRNKGAFWETKNIFGNHYPSTLKNAQKTRIIKQFFLSDRLSMDCTYI
jgi:hypothetical protein